MHPTRIARSFLLCLWLTTLPTAWSFDDPGRAVTPIRSLLSPDVGDQDDLCFWKHHLDESKSLVIASDKKSNRLFVYDLQGVVRQSIELPKPGNIDIRHHVRLGKEPWDLVAVNIRALKPMLRVFRVDEKERNLVAVDRGGIATRANYGGCLVSNQTGDKLSFVCTSESEGVNQYELSLGELGMVVGKEIRHLPLGKCEGAVNDDESESLFVAVENEGIWRFSSDPESGDQRQQIIPVGAHGLKADLEGLALANLPNCERTLIVSSQGSDKFFVFERQAPYSYQGEFQIDGARGTDGIDLSQGIMTSEFIGGIFGCHTDSQNHPILITSWDSILKVLPTTKSKSNE